MVTKLKLGTRFTLLLSLVFIGGVIVSGLVLWQVLQTRAQAEVTAQGVLLIETMSSVRSYTSNQIRPLLIDDLETSPTFIAQTVPAFSAREVFETFRHQEEVQTNFFYKEATLNPTNPRDKADSFEADLVERMRREPDLDEISGFRTLSDELVYYIARPLAISAESCLACHGEPESAPPSLLAMYGSEGGFGWQVNEIVAAQMIYVPAEQVFDSARRSFILVVGIFIGILAVVLLVLNFLLRGYVIHPIDVIAGLAHKMRADELVLEDLETDSVSRVAARADELGELTQSFRQMAREVYTRTQELKQRVRELHIEIDEIRRQKSVEEIVESDFFQDLQAKAREMRSQHRQEDDISKDE